MKIVYGSIAALLITWGALSAWAEIQHKRFVDCMWESTVDEWNACIESQPRLAVRLRKMNESVFGR